MQKAIPEKRIDLDRKPVISEPGNDSLNDGRNILMRVLSEAIDIGASDVHLQPDGNVLRVRIRIDGTLRDMERAIPSGKEASVIAALINMTDMRVDEHQRPMDDRVVAERHGKPYDLRINILPVKTGGQESMSRRSVAIRILSNQSIGNGLKGLGFTEDVEQQIGGILSNPNGMLLITGPTGSGKSTTLAAALQTLNKPGKKIITIEDPVEYTLPGVEQIEVNPRVDLTFDNALRAILRRDPDIVMVGEIRDSETAKMAANASLTGHLVLSTLHTNDAASATERLIDLGVKHFLLADILVGVVAQRLVRKICQGCKIDHQLSDDQLKLLNEHSTADHECSFYVGKGCEKCGQTGYSGRLVIHELLVVNREIVKLISDRALLSDIRKAAMSAGMVTMFDDGLAKAAEGLTTIDEVVATARREDR